MLLQSSSPWRDCSSEYQKSTHCFRQETRSFWRSITICPDSSRYQQEGLLEASPDSIWHAICEARHTGTSENETFPDDASDNSLNDTSDDRTSVDTEVDKDADELDEEEELEDLEAEEIANIQDEDVVEGWISVSYINTC
jgi:hypothetical protein